VVNDDLGNVKSEIYMGRSKVSSQYLPVWNGYHTKIPQSVHLVFGSRDENPPLSNTYSSGLRFAAPEAGEIQGKCVGGLAEETYVTAATRNSGRAW